MKSPSSSRPGDRPSATWRWSSLALLSETVSWRGDSKAAHSAGSTPLVSPVLPDLSSLSPGYLILFTEPLDFGGLGLLGAAGFVGLPVEELSLLVEQMSDAEILKLLADSLSTGRVNFTERIVKALAGRDLQSPELKRFVATFAPARICVLPSGQTEKDANANGRWCRENRSLFAGQWVALHDGKLLVSGPSLKEVHQALSDRRVPSPPLVFHIPRC